MGIKHDDRVKEPHTNFLSHIAGEEYVGKVSNRVAGEVWRQLEGGLGRTSPTLPSQGRRPWTSFHAKDVASLSREGNLTVDHTELVSVSGLRDSVLQGRNCFG